MVHMHNVILPLHFIFYRNIVSTTVVMSGKTQVQREPDPCSNYQLVFGIGEHFFHINIKVM